MSANKRRPVYVVQRNTGVMVPDGDGSFEEAVVVLGMRQTRDSANRLAALQDGAEVVKMFVVSE